MPQARHGGRSAEIDDVPGLDGVLELPGLEPAYGGFDPDDLAEAEHHAAALARRYAARSRQHLVET